MMERLGHSSITVTLNTYGHLMPGLDAALTTSLDQLGRGAQDAYRPAPTEVLSILSPTPTAHGL